MRTELTIAMAAISLWSADAGATEFFFLDRPGERLPEPLIPQVPLVDFEILPAAPPATGFANADALKEWLPGTIWEFVFPANNETGRSWLVRLRFFKESADFTWAGGCGWWCDSGGVAVLRHPHGHWTQKMTFNSDNKSFNFDNSWGTMRLIGRAPE